MIRRNENSPFKGGKHILKAIALVLAGSMLLGGAFSAQAAGLKDVFDAQMYSDKYQDLKAVFGTDTNKLYSHYITYGLSEDRTMNELIDVKKYREKYPDLNTAFGDNWDAYVQHYIYFGYKEGRDSFGTFDARAYADRYPDLKATFGDDVLALYRHYVTCGKAEGRDGSAYVVAAGSSDSGNGTSQTPDNNRVTVSGRLVDPETGEAIPNATIRVTPSNAMVARALGSLIMTSLTVDDTDANVSDSDDSDTTISSVSDGNNSGSVSSGNNSGSVSGGDAYTAITDENGNYVLELEPGTYTATVTAAGYIALTMDTLVVNAGETSVVPTITLLNESCDGETRIAGRLTNALNGEGVANATVELRNNWSNYTGSVAATATTNENGEYSIVVSRGYYTATFVAEGFVTKSQNVVSVTNYTSFLQNEALTPDNIAADSYRIVLTWGETPRDLDSHITGPTMDGSDQFHVYFADPYYTVDGQEIVTLDHDDVDSYGPETVTIITPQAGAVYRYSVHNFSGEAPISQSGATVVVYAGNSQVATYSVPVSGDGMIWNVFDIRNGQIVPMNTIVDGYSNSDAYYAEDLYVQ